MNNEFLESVDLTKSHFLQIHRKIKMLHLCGIALGVSIRNKKDEKRERMKKYKVEFETNDTKYLEIYRHIKKIIEKGQLRPNEKLPPLRRLSEFLGVNISTCVNAYNLLEKEHLIYKVSGSGCYVLPVEEGVEEETGKVRFDIGHPSTDMFPLENFRRSVEKAMALNLRGVFDYEEGLGYEKLREYLVRYLEQSGIHSNKERIQIISGAQQGISLVAKALLNYGDIIYVEEPSYHGAMEVFSDKKLKPVSIPMMHDGIDVGILKTKLERFRPSLIYVMPTYQNPTGVNYSLKKKKLLLELAAKYDFYIIEDDFLSDIEFHGHKEHAPLRSYDEHNRVIYIKSFSKILMPGLRIGFMEMPESFVPAIRKEKNKMDIAGPSIIQHSLYKYFQDFDWNLHLSMVQGAYSRKFELMSRSLEKGFTGLLEFLRPAGGTNAFFYLPKGHSAKDFRLYLRRQHNIEVLEGGLFGDSLRCQRGFRISCASLDEEAIPSSFELLRKATEEYLQQG